MRRLPSLAPRTRAAVPHQWLLLDVRAHQLLPTGVFEHEDGLSHISLIADLGGRRYLVDEHNRAYSVDGLRAAGLCPCGEGSPCAHLDAAAQAAGIPAPALWSAESMHPFATYVLSRQHESTLRMHVARAHGEVVAVLSEIRTGSETNLGRYTEVRLPPHDQLGQRPRCLHCDDEHVDPGVGCWHSAMAAAHAQAPTLVETFTRDAARLRHIESVSSPGSDLEMREYAHPDDPALRVVLRDSIGVRQIGFARIFGTNTRAPLWHTPVFRNDAALVALADLLARGPHR